MKTLIEKIARVQSSLKAPKSQYNKFGGYSYRSCEDILEGVKPLLAENGLILMISDEIEMVGNRYYVKATAIISDGEHELRNTAMAREEETKKGMDASQITGAASSYARKYALNGLLCIDDTKDADAGDNREPQNKEPKKDNPSKPELPKQDTEKNDEIVRKKVEECKASIAKHEKYTEGDPDHQTVARFANKIYELGYKTEANEIIALLEEKTEKDEIPF